MKIKDSQFFVSEQLGEHRAFSPEGYLICKDVPLARVGAFLYSAGELGLEGRDPMEGINVRREADELFAPESLASFEGKPVTDGHPEEFASLDNVKQLSCGHAQNVHREGDLMVADLIITDKKLIDKILSGHAYEISNGYDSEIEERNGAFYQTHFIGNHIAVVERGRCGSICSIGDKAMNLKDRLLALFKSHDEEEFKKAVEEVKDESREAPAEPAEEVKDEKPEAEEKQDEAGDPQEETETKDEAPEEDPKEHTEDEKPITREEIAQIVDECVAKALKARDEESKKVKDEAVRVSDEAVKDAVAQAEFIAPGIEAPAIQTQDELDAFKRDAMAKSKHAFIAEMKTADKAGAVLDSAFITAVASAKAINNATAPAKHEDAQQDYQQMLNDFWKRK